MARPQGVCFGSGYGLEDTDKLGLARSGGIDDFLDNRGVLVVKDVGSSTALDEVVVVGSGYGNDVDSCGRSELSRHRPDGRRCAVHDESLASRRCRIL